MLPRMSIKGCLTLTLLFAGLAAGCNDKDNADKCCTTMDACKTAGLDAISPCDTGVCFDSVCVRGCTADSDCNNSPDTPVCMSGVCSCSKSDTCGGQRPICDTASHDCRACTADSECDSGACDTGGGACVDAAAILYAAAGGAGSGDCTNDKPCSLAFAGTKVDDDHTWIVMQSGAYKDALTMKHNATIVGTDSTWDLPAAGVVLNKGTYLLRHLMISTGDVATGITCTGCTVTLDHIQAIGGTGATGLTGGPSVSASNSTFKSWPINLSVADKLQVVLDRSTFTASPIKVTSAKTGNVKLTNSVLADSGAANALEIVNTAGGTIVAAITNDTFANAAISCDGNALDDGDSAVFTSNIFYNTTLPKAADSCTFDYNLGSPAISQGKHDIVGDPKFVDAANHNFHLAAGSPAIDASISVAATRIDLDNVVRPQGKAYDIGAFESK